MAEGRFIGESNIVNYMENSSVHKVEENQSVIVIRRVKESRCDQFNRVVEAVLTDHPDATTHIDSDSGSYDIVIIAK